jgi:choline dehydrogenase-like flavoprotein
METYDLVIIGTGMGGGTLAYALRESGLKILLLERGDYLPSEPENWSPEAVFKQKRYKPKEQWFDHAGRPFPPGVHYLRGRATRAPRGGRSSSPPPWTPRGSSASLNPSTTPSRPARGTTPGARRPGERPTVAGTANPPQGDHRLVGGAPLRRGIRARGLSGAGRAALVCRYPGLTVAPK